VQNEACVRWFLEHGADPNQQSDKGFTPLASAALYPSITTIELLISYGAKLDPEALLSAIDRRGRGGLPVMRCLIDHGIDINAPLQPHGSPLHFAVYIAGPEQTRLLLDNGADRSMKNSIGRTPVEMAKSRMTKSEDAMKVYEILLK
jgi:ankyrin repeat protein